MQNYPFFLYRQNKIVKIAKLLGSSKQKRNNLSKI